MDLLTRPSVIKEGRASRGHACMRQDLVNLNELFPWPKIRKLTLPCPPAEDVVAFIAQAQGKVGKREIAQHFGIKGSDRIWLKQILKDLEIDGVVDRRGKTVHKAGQLPPVVMADITKRDRDGELIAVPTEWDEEEHGSIPTVIIVAPRKPRPGMPVAGVGDRALLRVDPLKPGDIHRYSGRVIKIIAKKQAQVLGIFRAMPEGGGRLIPVDKKSRDQELQIKPGDEGEALDGDLIAVSVVKHGRFGPSHRQGQGAAGLGEIRKGREPDRDLRSQHSQ